MVTQDKVVAKLDRILTLPDSEKNEIIMGTFNNM